MKHRQSIILGSLAATVLIVYGFLVAAVWIRSHRSPPVVVQLVSPLPGELLTDGEAIQVKTAITGQGVVRMELAVDGQTISAIPNPDPTGQTTWVTAESWTPAFEGSHLLEARAFRDGQEAVVSATADVEVVPPGRIAFASKRTGSYQIFSIDSAGRVLRQETQGNEDHRQPAWSPTGLLAFSVGSSEGPDTIWQLAPDGTSLALTSWLSRNRGPAWSPLGDSLLFSSDHGSAENLYILDSHGGEPVQLTDEQFFAGQPSWSPDGQSVVFTVQRDGNWDIYRIGRDGSHEERLTSNIAQDWFPAWSPAGDRIAFVSNRAGTHQLYVMKADGTDQTRLTNLPRGVESPAWSPDGRWLVFAAYTGDAQGVAARELHLLRVEDGHQVRVTHNLVDDTEPAWFYPPPSVTGMPSPPRTGFFGEYYTNMTMSGAPAVIRFDPAIDFDWGAGAPADELRADHFSVRWVGRLTALEAQDYLFSLSVDDGARLFVDGVKIADSWDTHVTAAYSVPMRLSAGDHVLRLEYYENDGFAHVSLHWRVLR